MGESLLAIKFNNLQKYSDLCITQMIVAFSLYNDSQMINLTYQAMTLLKNVSTEISNKTFPPEEADSIRAILRLLRVDEALKILQKLYNENKTIQKGGAKCDEDCYNDGDCIDDPECPICVPDPGAGVSVCRPDRPDTLSVPPSHPIYKSKNPSLELARLTTGLTSTTSDQSNLPVAQCMNSVVQVYTKQMDNLIARRDKLLIRLDVSTKEYRKEVKDNFEKRVKDQAAELSSRKYKERGPAAGLGVVGGITAYKFTSSASALLKAASSTLLNGAIQIGFTVLNLLSIGNQLSDCATEAAARGEWMRTPTGAAAGADAADAPPASGSEEESLPACSEQTFFNSISPWAEACAPGPEFTCKAWEGADIDEVTNITMVATVAGVVIPAAAVWLLARQLLGQNKLSKSTPLGWITKVGVPGLGWAWGLFDLALPSDERRGLEERVIAGRVTNIDKTLEDRAGLLRRSADEYSGTAAYRGLKAELDRIDEQMKQCQKNIDESLKTAMTEASRATKRKYDEVMLLTEIKGDVLLAVVKGQAAEALADSRLHSLTRSTGPLTEERSRRRRPIEEQRLRGPPTEDRRSRTRGPPTEDRRSRTRGALLIQDTPKSISPEDVFGTGAPAAPAPAPAVPVPAPAAAGEGGEGEETPSEIPIGGGRKRRNSKTQHKRRINRRNRKNTKCKTILKKRLKRYKHKTIKRKHKNKSRKTQHKRRINRRNRKTHHKK